MGNKAQRRESSEFPWGAIIATAAVGALAFTIFKKVQSVRQQISPVTLDDALGACSKAAEVLDTRIDAPTYSATG